jgi:hypothetical protein
MWAERQLAFRDRHWPTATRLLDALPQPLWAEVKLLEYDLALRHSDTGQFRDIFLGADRFPLLSLADWLLDDLGPVGQPRRSDAERRLFIASLLLAIRAQAIDSLLDQSSLAGGGRLALAQYCSERLVRELGGLIPSDSPAWEQVELASLTQSQGPRVAAVAAADAEPDAYLDGGWTGAARMIGLAVVEVTRSYARSDAILDLLARLTAAFQVRDELSSIHHDLLQGRVTYPMAVVARRASIPLDPPPEPLRILGALATSGALAEIVGMAGTMLADCRRQAAQLELPTVGAYLDDAHARLVLPAGDAPTAVDVSRPLVTLSQPTLPKALSMGHSFLLADPTLRESWELHREGMFGAEVVASRFPAGLILEILVAHGLDVTAQVDDFLSFTAANGFRYYDHPWSAADSDTVGVYLRLVPCATRPAEAEAAATAILDCLAREVVEEGRNVPVWINGCADGPGSRPPVIDLGEGCATVAAHLLLGLVTTKSERYGALLEIGARNLFERIASAGMGANVNYPPRYALAIFSRLVSRLADFELPPDLAQQATTTRGMLQEELERRSRATPARPQEAALATIACRAADRVDLVRPEWQATLLRSQRFDGSWPGEPFAAAPNRGGAVSWYSSTTLTTAVCLDALSHWADA